MAVGMANIAQNVQQTITVARQTVQVDQVASAAIVEAANQTKQTAVSEATETVEVTPADEARGQNLDVQA
ncbi:MAG: hypothetical protein JKY92_02550 [Magnetovibrio sp.]|nr:hypothetical protein [Magnetovibrio sp.]